MEHADSHETHVVPLSVYFGVFLALLVGTAITVWAASVDLGRWNVVVALAIAGIKATLVVLYFMHVYWSPQLVRLVVGASLAWLGILLVITLSDYWSRGWLGFPGS